jgi:hypothetical protein
MVNQGLKTIAGYGLNRPEPEEPRRIAPKVTHERVKLGLPITQAHKRR